MLELGLQRVSHLVNARQFPWRAIHVAGTNGKGSVCAFASSMLAAAGLSVGRFTSPHLIDRWDCISINGRSIDEARFRAIEDQVKSRDQQQRIGATEFELLTATAFKAFAEFKIQVGVVEVGLGGRLDATNVLRNPLATVITRIAKDHEALLGNNIHQIATEKAGIMKLGAPCFVDYANKQAVGDTLFRCAALHKAGSLHYVDADAPEQHHLWQTLDRETFAPSQQIAVALAYQATKSALDQQQISFQPDRLIAAARDTVWPARLQILNISNIASRKADIFLDGAHNHQAARALGQHVDTLFRPKNSSVVTWIIAASEGKDLHMFSEMIRSGDHVITVEFEPVDGMPWVHAVNAGQLSRDVHQALGDDGVQNISIQSSSSLVSALAQAVQVAAEGPLVIAGSLYLAADVLRLHRSSTKAPEARSPG